MLCLKDVSPVRGQLSSFRSCLLGGLLFVLVLMYQFSILKLAVDGIEVSLKVRPVVSAKQAYCKPLSRQTAGTGETPRAVLALLARPAGGRHQSDSSPSQAQHKGTTLLQLEFLRLKTILVCVTKHQLPQSYSLTWCEMVQLCVLRNGRLNFSPSWLRNQNGPLCSQ